MTTIFGWLLGAVVVLGVLVGGAEVSFRLYQHYNPAYEQVRRTTYEQSRAFQEGTIRDMENLRIEYSRGNAEQKAAIREVIGHRLADVPRGLLTPQLQQFADQVDADRLNGGN